MSVSLMKRSRRDPGRVEEVPIASNSAFEQYWLQGARARGLVLVPLLWEPFSPNEDERRQLLRELETLREWAREPGVDDGAQLAFVVDRIDSLRRALEADTDDDFTFCFG